MYVCMYVYIYIYIDMSITHTHTLRGVPAGARGRDARAAPAAGAREVGADTNDSRCYDCYSCVYRYIHACRYLSISLSLCMYVCM